MSCLVVQPTQTDFAFFSWTVNRQRFGDASGECGAPAIGAAPKGSTTASTSLSPSSADSELGRQEQNESFLASLVDSYFSTDLAIVPLIKWRELVHIFMQCGRRTKQLPEPATRALIHCVFVFGALTGDAPALVGKDAAAARLLSSRQGQDLSAFGKARRSVVHNLLGQFARLNAINYF